MTNFWNTRAALRLGAAMTVLLAATAVSRAQSEDIAIGRTVPPPMSVPTAKYYAAHPAAYARFLAQLPHREPGARAATKPRVLTTAGGTWATVTKAPAAGLSNPLLLTDGTVIVADGDTPNWYKLTPDSSGNYADGTWTQIASLPMINGSAYGPLYHASAVLPSGKVIIMGGEYNNSNHGVWTNEGAIYDPVANTWTAVSPPLGSGWSMIGDAESVVLADGTFMLAACCAFNPPVDALFLPKSLGWVPTGAPRGGHPIQYQDEQGYTLLPSGDVLTVEVWTNYPTANPTNAERYIPGSHKWVSAGNTPVSVVDPIACGNFEIGPAPLRSDGTVVQFGGNTGCVMGATSDPIAIYDSKANSWTSAPDVPAVCGSDGATSCDLADAPAAVEPNGNVLFAASAGYGGQPTHFFEFTPGNTINQVSDTVDYASTSGAYYYNFLVLPNGQILSTDFSKIAEVYTPASGPLPGLAPTIYSAPSSVVAGKTYQIVGAQISGLSQGGYYGDDVQTSTNYPIARITNVASGDVVYAKTTGFSTYSVAPKALGSTNVTVPATIETGSSTLVLIANGIASNPVLVTVNAPKS
jgi:hypothetical protein